MINVEYSANGLYSRLQVANKLLKGDITSSERMALCTYKNNLYNAIGAIERKKKSIRRRHIFGSNKYYKRFNRDLFMLDAATYNNIINNKDFVNAYFSKVVSFFEHNFPNDLDFGADLYTKLSMEEFNDIFCEFMKSINLDDFLEDFLERGRLYSYDLNQESIFGYTLFNPLNHDADILIGEFLPDISSLLTLAHEMGHVYDLSLFNKGAASYNRYFYQSFYGEGYAKSLERSLLRFMINNDILKEQAQYIMLESEKDSQAFFLIGYILTLLDDCYIENGRYKALSRDELYLLVKGFFRNDIRSFIDEVECFDIIETLLYAFGDVMSMFLLEDTEDRGFSSPLNKKFIEERDHLLRSSFLTSNGLSSDRYCTLYEKQLKLLKK